MSSGPKNVTSTTNTEPPSYLVPSLTAASNAAASQFFGSPVQTNVGTSGATGAIIPPGIDPKRVARWQRKFGDDLSGAGPGKRKELTRRYGVDFSPQFTSPTSVPGQFSTAGTGRDLTGIPTGGASPDLIGQAQDLTSRTIGGDFLSPGSNPYLDQTFQRGADAITQRLNTNFARSGRDLAAARPVAADELGTFASQLYGDNLRFERGNQIGAARDALDFDPLNLFINRLAGIIPGAGGTTQSTQPVFRTGLF